MKRMIIGVILVLLMMSFAFPALADSPIAGATPTDYILITNSTRIKVREEPDSESDQLGWADSGSQYPYLGSVRTWYCIDYHGSVGYLSNTLGGVISGNNGAKYVTVTSANGINVRSQPDSKSKQIGKGDMKDIYLCKGTENGWYEVVCEGKTGYVSQKLTKQFSNGGSVSSSFVFLMNESSSEVNDDTPTDFVRITNKTRIGVRREATAESEQIGYAEANQSYPYLGTIGAWYCIRYNGGIGYISDNLSIVEQKEGSKAQYVAISHTSGVNVRSTPFENGKKIGATDPGNKYLYKGTENGWYKILFGESIGYVSSKLTTLTDGKTVFSRVYIAREVKEDDDWDDDDGDGKNKKECPRCKGSGFCGRCIGGRTYTGELCMLCAGTTRCGVCAGFGHLL